MNNHVDKSSIGVIYSAKCLFLLHACYIARNFSKSGHLGFFAASAHLAYTVSYLFINFLIKRPLPLG
jgi:hypothetical protein